MQFYNWLAIQKSRLDEDKLLNELRDIEKQVYEALSLDTKELFSRSIPSEAGFRGHMLEIEKGLAKEFDAKTVPEKCLCQIAAMAFVSYLHVNYETLCYSYYDDHKYDQRRRNGYLMAMTKEKNNAFRQFNSAVQTLRHLKAPPLKLNVVAQNFNMGQNQQFNTEKDYASKINASK